MDDNLSEQYKNFKLVLRQEASEMREKNFDNRLKYAEEQFKKNNIPYKICNKEIGHFNLYKNNKVVMSFWSYTGKCYIPSKQFSENIGIRNCIKEYKKIKIEEDQ